jgi:putative tryptophan/tyrosine transport system substrate-binding protein
MTGFSRRSFVGGLGASAVGVALAGGCRLDNLVMSSAQRIHRIGALLPNSRAVSRAWWDAFVDELRTNGWVEGQNLTIEWRAADNQVPQLPGLAADLVRLPVEVIVTDGAEASLAAKQATSAIPIVFFGGDPVETGLVASLARPGGNVTGTSTLQLPLVAKEEELLSEVVPGLSQLAVLRDRGRLPAAAASFAAALQAAQTLGLDTLELDVRTVEDVAGAFARAIEWGANGLLIMPSPAYAGPVETRIAELAAQNRLPAMYPLRHYVEAGGLMSCGANQLAAFRRVATYVDRILRGAKPGDLPVEQSRTFDFIVNVRAARALGITIPPDVAAQVTEWVE